MKKTLIVLTGLERYVFIPDRANAQDEIKKHPLNVDAIYTYSGRFSIRYATPSSALVTTHSRTTACANLTTDSRDSLILPPMGLKT